MDTVLQKVGIVGLLWALLFAALTFADDTVVATVNDIRITAAEVAKEYNAMPAAQVNVMGATKAKDTILQNLITDAALLSYAKKSNVEADPAYIEALKDFQSHIARQVYIQNLVAEYISDAALKKAYEKEYSASGQEEIKGRHILLKDKEAADTLLKELTVKKTVTVDDFAALAKEHSTGPSGANGGDLGWFDAKTMVPAFSKAAFSLEDGAYTTEPVKTRFGYHLIFVEERRTATPPSFESVKKKLEQQIAQEKIYNHLQTVRDAASVDINEKELKALKHNPVKPSAAQ